MQADNFFAWDMDICCVSDVGPKQLRRLSFLSVSFFTYVYILFVRLLVRFFVRALVYLFVCLFIDLDLDISVSVFFSRPSPFVWSLLFGHSACVFLLLSRNMSHVLRSVPYAVLYLLTSCCTTTNKYDTVGNTRLCVLQSALSSVEARMRP